VSTRRRSPLLPRSLPMRRSCGLSSIIQGLALVILVAVVARVAEQHVRLHAFPAWCDGIDDDAPERFWGMPEGKKDAIGFAVKMRASTRRSEPRADAAHARTSALSGEVARPAWLLFRPRLFSVRAVGNSGSANPG
jgi:hypothetical protein